MEEKTEGSAVPPWNLAKISKALEANLLKVLNPGSDRPYQMPLAHAASDVVDELVGREESLSLFRLRTVDTKDDAAKAVENAWEEAWSQVRADGNLRARMKTFTLDALCVVGPQNPDDAEETLKRCNSARALSVAERRSDAALRDAVRVFFEDRLEKALREAEGPYDRARFF